MQDAFKFMIELLAIAAKQGYKSFLFIYKPDRLSCG